MLSNTSPSQPIYRGSCLCGGVRYQLTGEPFTHLVCHCINCQKVTGTAFASNVFFHREQLEITKGEAELKEYADLHTQSGKPYRRAFCGLCGSFLLGFPEQNPKIVIAASGSLDEGVQGRWAPTKEFYDHNKRPWLPKIPIGGDAKL
ncbi:Mss4-like protein [Schizophyllum fasciatum]